MTKILLIIMHFNTTVVSRPYDTMLECLNASILAQAIRYHLPDYHIGCTLPHAAPWRLDYAQHELDTAPPWRIE